ncbi:MAG: acyl carrier protein, partial [Desulfobacterales bacterium]
ADPEHRSEMLLEHICFQARNVFRLDKAMEIRVDQGFADLGMDSVMAVELTTRLMSSLNCSLPATLLFDYPTVEAVADYLRTRVECLNTEKNSTNRKTNRDDVQDERCEEMETLTGDVEKELALELERAGY